MNLQEIKQILSEYELKDESLQLSPCELITDQNKFIQSHLSALENNKGNRAYLPYYKRLVKFVKLIKT